MSVKRGLMHKLYICLSFKQGLKWAGLHEFSDLHKLIQKEVDLRQVNSWRERE